MFVVVIEIFEDISLFKAKINKKNTNKKGK